MRQTLLGWSQGYCCSYMHANMLDTPGSKLEDLRPGVCLP